MQVSFKYPWRSSRSAERPWRDPDAGSHWAQVGSECTPCRSWRGQCRYRTCPPPSWQQERLMRVSERWRVASSSVEEQETRLKECTNVLQAKQPQTGNARRPWVTEESFCHSWGKTQQTKESPFWETASWETSWETSWGMIWPPLLHFAATAKDKPFPGPLLCAVLELIG